VGVKILIQAQTPRNVIHQTTQDFSITKTQTKIQKLELKNRMIMQAPNLSQCATIFTLRWRHLASGWLV
jgi:hypothetical protein